MHIYKKHKNLNVLIHFILNLLTYNVTIQVRYHMEASEPKWVNLILNIYGVNSLRLGVLHVISNNHLTHKRVFSLLRSLNCPQGITKGSKWLHSLHTIYYLLTSKGKTVIFIIFYFHENLRWSIFTNVLDYIHTYLGLFC